MSSIILLPNTQGSVDVTSPVARAAGWYGYNSNLSTVSISTNNFVGRIFLEASLALVPTVNDWFAVQLKLNSDYLEYPLVFGMPTGLNNGDTGTTGYTFKANILFIRVRVVRSYLFPIVPPSQDQIDLLGNARVVLSL